MNTHTVWTFDDKYFNIDEKNYRNGIADVEAAMMDKQPIDLGGSLVAGASIARIDKFGNKEEYGPRIGTGMAQVVSLLENGKKDKPVTKETRDKILATLRTADETGTIQKKSYFATRRLGEMLHDTSSWGEREWERFASEHPDPWTEYEESVGHENAYSELYQKMPEPESV